METLRAQMLNVVANVGDHPVEPVKRRVDPAARLLRRRVQPVTRIVEQQADRIDRLNHPVVQIHADPLPLPQDGNLLVFPVQLGVLDRDRSLQGKHPQQLFLLHTKPGGRRSPGRARTLLVCQIERAIVTALGAQPHPNQRTGSGRLLHPAGVGGTLPSWPANHLTVRLRHLARGVERINRPAVPPRHHQRTVRCAHQHPALVDDLLQHLAQFQLGGQRQASVAQRFQMVAAPPNLSFMALQVGSHPAGKPGGAPPDEQQLDPVSRRQQRLPPPERTHQLPPPPAQKRHQHPQPAQRTGVNPSHALPSPFSPRCPPVLQ